MIRRILQSSDEQNEGGGLTALASVSDLMMGLMVVFLWLFVVQSEASKTGIKSDLRAGRSTKNAAESWGQSYEEFKQRQLRLRVAEVHQQAFKNQALQGSRIVANVPLISNNRGTVELSEVARKTALDTAKKALTFDWSTIKAPNGCELGVVAQVQVDGAGPTDQLGVLGSTAKTVQNTINTGIRSQERRVGLAVTGYEWMKRPRVQIAIGFSLLPSTEAMLATRFKAGPGSGASEALLCR